MYVGGGGERSQQCSPFPRSPLLLGQSVTLEEQHVVCSVGIREGPVLGDPDGGVRADQVRHANTRTHVGVILQQTQGEGEGEVTAEVDGKLLSHELHYTPRRHPEIPRNTTREWCVVSV